MGLDIYAGTLTRYYSHNWKTVVQQWTEENAAEKLHGRLKQWKFV